MLTHWMKPCFEFSFLFEFDSFRNIQFKSTQYSIHLLLFLLVLKCTHNLLSFHALSLQNQSNYLICLNSKLKFVRFGNWSVHKMMLRSSWMLNGLIHFQIDIITLCENHVMIADWNGIIWKRSKNENVNSSGCSRGENWKVRRYVSDMILTLGAKHRRTGMKCWLTQYCFFSQRVWRSYRLTLSSWKEIFIEIVTTASDDGLL